MRDIRSPTARTRLRAGATRRITPSTCSRRLNWSGVIGATLAAPLVEVELGQGRLGHLGGDFLRRGQVARADGQVVDSHDPGEAAVVGDRQPAYAVLDHESHRL